MQNIQFSHDLEVGDRANSGTINYLNTIFSDLNEKYSIRILQKKFLVEIEIVEKKKTVFKLLFDRVAFFANMTGCVSKTVESFLIEEMVEVR